MSIWCSIHPSTLDEIPQRDRYTGDPIDGLVPIGVDVATATSWNNLVRLSIYGGGYDQATAEAGEVLITADEVHELIRMLTEAVERMKAS